MEPTPIHAAPACPATSQPRATANANAALHLTIMLQARSLARVLIGTQDPTSTKRREHKDRSGTCKTAQQCNHAAHTKHEERATKQLEQPNAQTGEATAQRLPQAGFRKALRAVFRSGAPGRWGGCLGQVTTDLDRLGLGHLRHAKLKCIDQCRLASAHEI
jgi:hypothetical protein